MKKILCSFFAALLVVCATVTPALAKGYNDISTTYVRDHYQLLSDSTLQSMEAEAESLSDTYKCDVYLTIVDDIGTYTVRQFAEAYWNYYDLGRGTNKDGIMFLIAVDSRDYVTITHGQGTTGGITIFTDYRIEQIEYGWQVAKPTWRKRPKRLSSTPSTASLGTTTTTPKTLGLRCSSRF